jgi:hypothetical protein
MIEQSRDWETISGLEGPDCCLRLRRKAAIDWTRVKPQLSQMHFRDLDFSLSHESVQGWAFTSASARLAVALPLLVPKLPWA